MISPIPIDADTYAQHILDTYLRTYVAVSPTLFLSFPVVVFIIIIFIIYYLLQ